MQFKNPFDPDNVEITRKVKEWTRDALDLPANSEIIVQEVNCADANCPDIETLISVLRPARQYFRIRKPLVFVRKWDFNKIVPSYEPA